MKALPSVPWQEDLSEAFGRLDRSGADPALIALAKRFLEPDATARIPNAGAAAEAVAAYRSGVEERLRRTENDRARAEARAAELRKRRKVQAALAVALVILVAGGGIAGWWYDRTVEKRRSDTELANLAERERLARNEQAIEIALAQADSASGRNDANGAAIRLLHVEKLWPVGASEALLARCERCKKDLAMLEELDRIDDFRWTALGDGQSGNKQLSDEKGFPV